MRGVSVKAQNGSGTCTTGFSDRRGQGGVVGGPTLDTGGCT